MPEMPNTWPFQVAHRFPSSGRLLTNRIRRHTDAERLARAVGRCLPKHVRPWSGEAFRITAVRYANRDDVITGVGSKSAGGRWNPPASFATVYASLDAETALAEALAHFRYYGIPEIGAMPLVTVALKLRLRRVLDLTAGTVRSTLKVSATRILSDDWRKARARRRESLTQALGRTAYEAQLEAVVVPSAARLGAKNLVLFPGNLLPPGSWVQVLNRDELPPLL